ncbi:hypothetical protein QJS04_geneDACA001610 [Acorus gramineus]|uniref:Uncharacterized protein n=1 Tax=Acorus gramineus TaxID=55184 RepID=A0AAV9BGH1_ACOGR|nr:hypothetical protein QJS04_geneDACA001610 [Acorus gramineus]
MAGRVYKTRRLRVSVVTFRFKDSQSFHSTRHSQPTQVEIPSWRIRASQTISIF